VVVAHQTLGLVPLDIISGERFFTAHGCTSRLIPLELWCFWCGASE